MENKPLSAPIFDQVASPFSVDSNLVKSQVADLNEDQFVAMDDFVKSLGNNAAPILEGMTREKLNFLQAIFAERQQTRLAIARWNWMAKSIKYSFISLILTMTSGYFLGFAVEDSQYDIFDLLQKQVGLKWMKRWFLALFFGSAHNVYDSIAIQRGVKKVREFSQKWMNRILRRKKGNEKENEKEK